MVKKQSFFLLILLLVATGFFSCRKNRDKISLSRWHPGVVLPFIQTELKLSDIIPLDSTLSTGSDSLLYYGYHRDSLFVVNTDSIFSLPANGLDTNYTFKLGTISVDTFGFSSVFTMNQALPYLDPAVRDTLMAHNQTVYPLPPFAFDAGFTVEGQPIEQYEYLTFSGGYIALDILNGLPVALTNVDITVTDKNNGTVLKNIIISHIDSSAVYRDTIFLKGKTLGNVISYTVNGFSSDGSYPDSVYIDLDQGLVFNATGKELEVVNGKAKVPQQIMFSDTKTVDFATEEGVRLYHLLFSQGTMNFTVHSQLAMRVYIELKLPTGMINGVIPHADIVLPANGTYEGGISFEDMELNLDTDSLQPFNRFPVYAGIVIMPTAEMVEFDSSNTVRTDFYSSGIKPAFARGYFGKRSVSLAEGTVSIGLDALSGINGTIYFDNPELKIHYGNSFGIPMKLKIDLTAQNGSTGQQAALALDTVVLAYPGLNTGYVSSTINVDKTNSEIVDFIAVKPDSVHYSGGGLINWNTDTLNYIYDTSSIVAGMDLHIPMVFKAGHLVLTDSVSVTPLEEGVPLQESAFNIQLENGFPFDMDLTMQLSDSLTGELLKTLHLGQIKAAPVNAEGRVIEPVRDSLNITFDESFFEAMKRANRGIFTAKTSTFSQGTVPVGLYSDYKMKIAVGITAVINP